MQEFILNIKKEICSKFYMNVKTITLPIDIYSRLIADTFHNGNYNKIDVFHGIKIEYTSQNKIEIELNTIMK